MIITIEGKEFSEQVDIAKTICQIWGFRTDMTQAQFKEENWKDYIPEHSNYVVIDEIYDYLKMYLFIRDYTNRVQNAPYFILIRQTTTTTVFSKAETMV